MAVWYFMQDRISNSSLKGTVAKAKANASQGIPELIEIAVGKHFRENNEEKHNRNAKYGWYRYDSRFALPVYGSDGEVERYNVFHASLVVRHNENGKMYLYDIIDIKKRNEQPAWIIKTVHDKKPISLFLSYFCGGDSDDEAAKYAEEVDGVKLIHDIRFEPGDPNYASGSYQGDRGEWNHTQEYDW